METETENGNCNCNWNFKLRECNVELSFFFTCLGAARTPPPGRFFFLVRGMFFLHQKLVGVFFSLSITYMFVHSLIMWNSTAALLLNIFPGLPDPIIMLKSSTCPPSPSAEANHQHHGNPIGFAEGRSLFLLVGSIATPSKTPWILNPVSIPLPRLVLFPAS